MNFKSFYYILLYFLIQGVELHTQEGCTIKGCHLIQKEVCKRVNSAYDHLIPEINPEKKEFFKDGPYRPLDKAVIYTWTSIKRFYHCQTVAQNGTSSYCQTWSADAGDGTVGEYADYKRAWGECKCLENAGGVDYCTFWYCGQQELDVSATFPENGRPIRHEDRDINYIDCVCRYESSNGKYCHQWWCQKSGGNRNDEVDKYTCDEPSKNGNFCQTWRGYLLQDWHRGWSRCTCRRPLTEYCEYWTCYEKALKRLFFINFIFLMLCLVSFYVAILVYAGHEDYNDANICIIVLSGIVLCGLCLLCAGLFGFILGLCSTIFLIIFARFIWGRCPNFI